MPDPQLLLSSNQKILIHLSRTIIPDEKICRIFPKLFKSLNSHITPDQIAAYIYSNSSSSFNDLIINYFIPTIRKNIRLNTLFAVVLSLIKWVKLPGLDVSLFMKFYTMPITNTLSLIPLVSQTVNIALNGGKYDGIFKRLIDMIIAFAVFNRNGFNSKLSFKIKLYLAFYSLFYTVQSQLSVFYQSHFIDNSNIIENYKQTKLVQWIKKLTMMGMLFEIYTYSKTEAVPGLVSKLIEFLQLQPLSSDNKKSLLTIIGTKWIRLSLIILTISLISKAFHTFKTEFVHFKESETVKRILKSSLYTSSILTLTFSLLQMVKNKKLKFLIMAPLVSLINQSDFTRSYLLKTFLMTKFTKALLDQRKNKGMLLDTLTHLGLIVGAIGIGGGVSEFDDDGNTTSLGKIRGLFMGL